MCFSMQTVDEVVFEAGPLPPVRMLKWPVEIRQ
jgi:hypothetical protein